MVAAAAADGSRWIDQFFDIESRFCRTLIDCRTSITNPNLHPFFFKLILQLCNGVKRRKEDKIRVLLDGHDYRTKKRRGEKR